MYSVMSEGQCWRRYLSRCHINGHASVSLQFGNVSSSHCAICLQTTLSGRVLGFFTSVILTIGLSYITWHISTSSLHKDFHVPVADLYLCLTSSVLLLLSNFQPFSCHSIVLFIYLLVH